nr:uncharacterized protein LOC123754878 [Procambarus clarkii]
MWGYMAGGSSVSIPGTSGLYGRRVECVHPRYIRTIWQEGRVCPSQVHPDYMAGGSSVSIPGTSGLYGRRVECVHPRYIRTIWPEGRVCPSQVHPDYMAGGSSVCTPGTSGLYGRRVECVHPRYIRTIWPEGRVCPPQVVRHLGQSRAGQVKVVQGQRLTGESPIYFIRLPPSSYYFSHNTFTSAATHPLHKVYVEFVNNGKPQKVYHWNLPLTSHNQSPPPSQPPPQPPSPPHHTTSTIERLKLLSTNGPEKPAPMLQVSSTPPPQLTTVAPRPSTTTPHPPPPTTVAVKSSKLPWFMLKKNYVYNGRPSQVYIWKGNTLVSTEKFQHARAPLGPL